MKAKVLVILMAVLMASSVASAESYKFVTLEFPPLEYKGPEGEATGIAVDIVKKIMSNLGHQVKIEVLPWARALHSTKTGEADAIFTAYKNAERETFLDYSKSVLIPQIISLYVPSGSAIQFDGDLLKLKDKSIGVISTISYGKKFDSVRDQLKLDRGEILDSNFKKLLAGRVDVVVSNMYVADNRLKKMGLQGKIKKMSPGVESVDSFIAFSKAKGLTSLRDKFDSELQKMIASGEYDAILAKYGVSNK